MGERARRRREVDGESGEGCELRSDEEENNYREREGERAAAVAGPWFRVRTREVKEEEKSRRERERGRAKGAREEEGVGRDECITPSPLLTYRAAIQSTRSPIWLSNYLAEPAPR